MPGRAAVGALEGLIVITNERVKSLAEMLERFEPYDAEEATERERMVGLLAEAGESAFSRSHFEPGHFTASAFILSPGGDELLMILHSKLKVWLQPGGHVDPEDADLHAAALREIEEEVGLGADAVAFVSERASLFDLSIHSIPVSRKKNEPAHLHFDARVLMRAASREFEAGSDALSAKWMKIDEIAEAFSDESVMRAARKLRGR